jgi:hypothetical protein
LTPSSGRPSPSVSRPPLALLPSVPRRMPPAASRGVVVVEEEEGLRGADAEGSAGRAVDADRVGEDFGGGVGGVGFLAEGELEVARGVGGGLVGGGGQGDEQGVAVPAGFVDAAQGRRLEGRRALGEIKAQGEGAGVRGVDADPKDRGLAFPYEGARLAQRAVGVGGAVGVVVIHGEGVGDEAGAGGLAVRIDRGVGVEAGGPVDEGVDAVLYAGALPTWRAGIEQQIRVRSK